MHTINNKKGQSLIEYLVLVCLIAVGSLAVIRVVGKNVRVQFANISRALGGQSEKLETEKVTASDYSKRDLSDFMTGAGNENGGSSGGSSRSSRNGSPSLPDRTMPGPVNL